MDVLTRPFEDAPWDMVEDVARQMRELKLPMKYLHEMGEPFLYKRLPEAIDLFPGRLRLDERDAPERAVGEGHPGDLARRSSASASTR